MIDNWSVESSGLYPVNIGNNTETLENIVYKLGLHPLRGWVLQPFSKGFDFEHKVYGLEEDFINHIIRSYNGTEGNMGVLLNGIKGAGKSVSAKILANRLEQPVILIEANFGKEMVDFLSAIKQNVTIFCDEYEKIFKGVKDGDGREEDATLLTLMDGVMKTKYRKAFILTTNQIRINENMIQRPGRVRYLKEFGNLPRHTIEEIVDDMLHWEKLRDVCIDFISQLEIITVDIVTSVISEVNIHKCDPDIFANIFNVKKMKRRHDAIWVGGGDNGDDYTMNFSQDLYYDYVNWDEGHTCRSETKVYGYIVSKVEDDDMTFIVRPHRNIHKLLKSKGMQSDEEGVFDNITITFREVPAYNTAYAKGYGY